MTNADVLQTSMHNSNNFARASGRTYGYHWRHAAYCAKVQRSSTSSAPMRERGLNLPLLFLEQRLSCPPPPAVPCAGARAAFGSGKGTRVALIGLLSALGGHVLVLHLGGALTQTVHRAAWSAMLICRLSFSAWPWILGHTLSLNTDRSDTFQ